MKQIIILILICMFNMLNLSKSNAQGVSLSFNLTETDTLDNMIADSKKYDISSLALSGYVNAANIKYILDINRKGALKQLDLGNISQIDIYCCRTKQKKIAGYFISNTNYPECREFLDYLRSEQFPDVEKVLSKMRNNGYPPHGPVTITIKDNYNLSNIERNFTLEYFVGENTSNKYETATDIAYSIKFPKLIFQDSSFDKLILPQKDNSIGGVDCSYRVNSCEEYVLGPQIKKIAENAFKDSYIGSLILSTTIDSIKDNAFENTKCRILSNLQFIESAKHIGECAFKNSSLTGNAENTIKLQANIIGKKAFLNAVIPNNVSLPNLEEIGDSAFMTSSINELELSDKIYRIGNSVFEKCEGLQTFKGGANISDIGYRAFYGCILLHDFSPSNCLMTIGQEAFFNNSALVSFTIPSTTKSIGYNAFANSGLKEINLGDFGDYRRDIVWGCDSLKNISANSSNTKLKSFNGVLLSKDESTILAYPCAKGNAMYEISNHVAEVADSAFYSVNKLRALTISETVTKIGKNAFGNSSINEIKVLSSTTPKVTGNISGLDQSLVRLFVHEKDYSTYYITNYWGDFKNIFILEKAISPENLINVEVAGTLPGYIGFGNQLKYNTLRLSGYLNSDDIRYLREMAGKDVRGNKTSGVLTDLDFSQAAIVKGGSYYYIKNENSSGKLSTSDNIVGESMFEGCNFTNLIISESATTIGDKALSGCRLESFKLPAATKELNPNSFFGMTTLKESIVDYDNPNFVSLNGVLFTKDGKSLLLYPYAKQGERYDTPETTTSIGEQAFGGSNLKVVVANEGLKEIGTMAFYNLGSLEGISLPSTLETIGHRAFYGCNNLLDITCKAYYPPTLKYDSYSYYGQPYNNFSDKTYKNAVLFVPKKNGGYTSRSGWKLFNNVIESDDWMSGIQAISGSDNAEIIKSYDLNGRVVTSSYHGVSILKMSNGTTKKVFVK